MSTNTKKKSDSKKDPTKAYEDEYPENGDNFKAGRSDTGALPNSPAENAEKRSPEEEKEEAEKE